jgi:hypothetical protein
MQVLLCCVPQPTLVGTQAAVRYLVMQPIVRECDLALLRNLRKQARMMLNWKNAQFVWNYQLADFWPDLTLPATYILPSLCQCDG